MANPWKLVVMGVVVRKVEQMYQILTQWRTVVDMEYDSLYDKTWEIMGETVKAGESIIEALRRGLAEECGLTDKYVIEAETTQFSSSRGDRYEWTEGLGVVQSLGEPQPWVGPVFRVKASEDFEPHSKDSQGEVGGFKWWEVGELDEAL